MTRSRSTLRDERGATAVLMAIVLAFTLLGIGAFAVDFGQVYAKRSSLQSAADQAVLAAAAELDGTATCSTPAVTAATTYLLANWIDQAGDSLTASDINLATGPDTDGFMECDGWQVRLWAPEATVDPGMANSLPGPDPVDISIPAYAEAGIFSPEGVGTMPAYAASGCDFGPQTLLDDSTADPVPTPELREDSPLPPNPQATIDVLTPDSIAVNTTDVVALSVTGNNRLAEVDQLAFTTPEAGSNIHVEVAPTTRASGVVTLNDVPATVKVTQGVWYVRVSRDGGTTWSDALPFLVGDALLECGSESSDGNFGALRLQRSDAVPGAWVPMNFALGVEFDLSRYPNPHSDWLCTSSDGSAIMAPNRGTNCVGTETGLPASDAESGLLTGKGITAPARLSRPNHPSCGGSQLNIDFGGSIGERAINNDRIDCFLESGATNAYQAAGYAGPAVLSSDILDSPRFTWIPVLGRDADNGSSDNYQITDFRPAFIEGPTDAANNEYNGLGFKAQGSALSLRSVKLTFFNVNALPRSISGGPTMPYIGVGTKVIALTD